MAIVINVSNFKGGVGKTTTSVIMSYQLAKAGKKVLFVDLDPQANGTQLLCKTYGVTRLGSTLYEAMKVGKMGDITECLVNLGENIDLVPSALSLVGFPLHLQTLSPNDTKKRAFYLDYLLTPIKNEYDYIIIDVPPTISDYTNNAIVASDYVLIVMQTQDRAKEAAKQMFPYVEQVRTQYGGNAEVLGIVPVLMSKKGSVDDFIMEEAKEIFGSLMFENIIETRERIKRFDVTGITSEDFHDYKVLNMYWKLFEEMEQRITKGAVTNG